MSAAPTTSQRGFTLLELVAALAIFALLAVMAYGGLNAIINTKQGVGQAQARMTQWQKGVFRLRADLESAIDRPIRDEFGDAQPALWRNPRGGLEFSRGGLRNPLQLPRSTMERVEYILQEDRLLRRSWGQLDRVQGDVGLSYPVLEGVEDLTWRYLNVDNEWIENWPPLELAVGDTANAGLPRAVELILITKSYGELRLLFAMAGA